MARTAQLNGHAGPEKSIGKDKKKNKSSKPKPKADSAIFASYIGDIAKDVWSDTDKQMTLAGKTTRSLSALLASLETMLTADAKRMAEFQQKKSILPVSVQVALSTRLPRSLTEHAAREGSNAVVEFQKHQKVKAPKAPKKNGLTGH